MSEQEQQRTSGTRYDVELIGMLQYVFITQRRHDLGKIASDLNMEYADLYAFITGRRTMPITLLKKISENTRDRIFLDTVFAGSSIHWDFAPMTRSHSNDPIKETLEMVHAVGNVCNHMRDALVDGRINPNKRKDILISISYAAQELDDLLEAVKSAKE